MDRFGLGMAYTLTLLKLSAQAYIIIIISFYLNTIRITAKLMW